MMKIFKTLFILGTFLTLAALKVNDEAPQFTSINQDGKVVKLSDYQGRFVLLYFYPKDNTPGCTQEACSFRDEYSKLKALNTVILGVSTQGQNSHLEFKKKHKLPFDLLVDKRGKLAESFGVGSFPLIGLIRRESVLIGPDQKIVKIYTDVNPLTHTQEVLEDIQKASTKGI